MNTHQMEPQILNMNNRFIQSNMGDLYTIPNVADMDFQDTDEVVVSKEMQRRPQFRLNEMRRMISDFT